MLVYKQVCFANSCNYEHIAMRAVNDHPYGLETSQTKLI